ncbi:hypothetical protein [Flavobacterium aquatile]
MERKNLFLRTHLNRLNPKNNCFTRNFSILNCIIRIYFWG